MQDTNWIPAPNGGRNGFQQLRTYKKPPGRKGRRTQRPERPAKPETPLFTITGGTVKLNMRKLNRELKGV